MWIVGLSVVLTSVTSAECGSSDQLATKFVSINLAQEEKVVDCPYDALPSGELVFKDLDGDGRDDIISIQPDKTWLWSKSGVEPWKQYGRDDTKSESTRHGDFDGDGILDTLANVGTNWYISYGKQGRSGYKDVKWTLSPKTSAKSLKKVFVVDVDADGKDDIFTIFNDGGWGYSSGARSGWRYIGDDTSATVYDILVGDFDGDGYKEAFKIDRGVWYSAKIASNSKTVDWKMLRKDDDINAKISDFAVGDLNGDGEDDIITMRNGVLKYSPGGKGNWRTYNRCTYPVQDLSFADFDGDGFTDVFYGKAGSTGYWMNNGHVGWAPMITNSCDCATRLLKKEAAEGLVIGRLTEEFKDIERGTIAVQGIRGKTDVLDRLAKALGSTWEVVSYSGNNGANSVAFVTNTDTTKRFELDLDGGSRKGVAMSLKMNYKGFWIWMIVAELSDNPQLHEKQIKKLGEFADSLDPIIPHYIAISTNSSDANVVKPLTKLKERFVIINNSKCTKYTWKESVEYCDSVQDYILARAPLKRCPLSSKDIDIGYSFANENNSYCPSKHSYRMATSHRGLYIYDNLYKGMDMEAAK